MEQLLLDNGQTGLRPVCLQHHPSTSSTDHMSEVATNLLVSTLTFKSYSPQDMMCILRSRLSCAERRLCASEGREYAGASDALEGHDMKVALRSISTSVSQSS